MNVGALPGGDQPSAGPLRARPPRRPLRAAAALALAAGLALVLANRGVFASIAAATTQWVHPARALPVLGRVPDFRLVDEHGAPFTEGSMRGHVSVVDFIFTRCPSSCPRLTSRMAQLQSRLAKTAADVRFVSFSVDPENDTPPVLAAYAAKAGADPARWSFVTGPADDVIRAVVLGFKVSAAKVATGANDYEVTHGNWFVLVDAAGNLRGYYPTVEDSDVDALVGDVLGLDRQRQP